MTKAKIRTLITKFHFYLLGIALLNFVLKSGIELSLNYKLSFLITLLIYISGIILFLWNFRPFKKIAIYFSDPDGHSLEFIGKLPGNYRPEKGSLVISYEDWLELEKNEK